ncbi:unnamed protein product [Paramecium octaurelia]|uniref:Uncharacterized protein n=1 Tax=Paramecium octaurelia TaxID=43137 RepID=A0A8S1VQ88_PAROT|nr:unnamed protein product [Paramecium octaurelia]
MNKLEHFQILIRKYFQLPKLIFNIKIANVPYKITWLHYQSTDHNLQTQLSESQAQNIENKIFLLKNNRTLLSIIILSTFRFQINQDFAIKQLYPKDYCYQYIVKITNLHQLSQLFFQQSLSVEQYTIKYGITVIEFVHYLLL